MAQKMEEITNTQFISADPLQTAALALSGYQFDPQSGLYYNPNAPEGKQYISWTQKGGYQYASSSDNPFNPFDPTKDPNDPNNPPGGGPSGGGGGGSGGVSLANAYQTVWSAYKSNSLSQGQINYLVSNQVSVAEFQQNLEHAQWIDQNKENIEQFKRVLQARGLLKPGQKVDPYEWFTAGIDPLHAAVWKEAAIRGTAANAGLGVGSGHTGDLALSRKDIQYIESTVPGTQSGFDPRSLAGTFQAFAAARQKFAAEGRFHEMGLRVRDFSEAFFGGPKQAEVLQKLAQLDALQQAEQQNLPNAQFRTRGASTSGGQSAY